MEQKLTQPPVTAADGNPTLRRLEIGVFAYNESDNIAATIKTLNRQDILDDPDFTVRIHILANGCSDDTVEKAKATIAGLKGSRDYVVHNLKEGGKSRTWNRFVHDLSSPDTYFLVFCDADIDIPNANSISRLLSYCEAQPGCVASSSEAVKDITHCPKNLSLQDRLISAAGGTLIDWKKSICGQLYLAKTSVVRSFHMPIGLPVEDGFVRAMIMTDVMRQPRDTRRIDSEEGIFHIYKSERLLRRIIRHQVRLVIGSSINSVIFGILHGSDDPQPILERAASEPDWLDKTLRQELPRKYGYVHLHFMTKRLKRIADTPWKRKPVIIVGFIFDCIVYAIAQFKMSRGVGVGFW